MKSNWPEVRLGDVVDLITGYPFRSAEYVDNPDGIKLLRGDNVVQGQLRWNGAKKRPNEKLEGVERYMLREGDTVLAMDRPWIEAGLKYASIRTIDLPALLVQRVSRLRETKSLDSRFLSYVIGSRQFTNHVLVVCHA
jgi:type I restriction enzyme S subunit